MSARQPSPIDPAPYLDPERPASSRLVRSILELVGSTPLVEIRKLGSDTPRAAILAKCEQQNPGGSAMDRACLAMVEAAERSGALAPGGVVVEGTSGNAGISLAIICAAKNYRCVVVMPRSASLERRAILRAYGAEVVLTEPELQLRGAVERAKEIARETPGAWVPDQFENPENPAAHDHGTAREIREALGDRKIAALVAGVGSGGTLTGVARAMRSRGRTVRVVAVEPAGSPMLSKGERGPTKIQGLGAGLVPETYDATLVDEVRTVSDRDAYRTKIALARDEGLLVGPSSGAAVWVALRVASELGPGNTVLTILPDTGERYFSMDGQVEGT